MSRINLREQRVATQDGWRDRAESWGYTLGLSDILFAEQMGTVRFAFRRGTFGQFATVENWIDEYIHPGYRDEALELVAKMRANP